MERSNTILVPVDFQDASLNALAYARELAPKLGLDVTLFHAYVIPLVVYPGFDPIVAPGLPEDISKAARASLERLAGEHGGLRQIVRAGDPGEEILRAIDETRPAMVVMGTHGRKGLSHLLLGSVAEQVIRSAKCPVITIHAPE